MDLGLTCHVCGLLNPIQAATCQRCSAVLYSGGAAAGGAAAGAGFKPAVVAASAVAAAPIEPAARFDPATGRPLQPADAAKQQAARTMFFGALQQEQAVPRLVLIKADTGEGITYHLQGTTTTLGRSGGDITFPDDAFLSPQHARFTSQSGRLFVQDLGSTNGVFLRIKQPRPMEDGAFFLVGEQLLRVQCHPFSAGGPSPSGTYFYGSPRPEAGFRVVQYLAGGIPGRVAVARGNSMTIGREGNDLNFPEGRFVSGHHARVDLGGDGLPVLTDIGSRNGTFVRMSSAQELFHGEFLFVGQQLLRVEIG